MKTSRGFIAIISVIILSVVLLAAAVSLAQYGVTTRYAMLDLERKGESETLASACVEVARIAVMNDPLYSMSFPGLSINVGTSTKTCRIETVSGGVVKVSASSTGAVTNLKATINTTTGNITKLEESPI